jgi:hypothetical protein
MNTTTSSTHQLESLIFGEDSVLSHPDEVGESAYRAVYDGAEAAFYSALEDGYPPEEALDMVLSELDNFVESARAIKARIVEGCGGDDLE